MKRQLIISAAALVLATGSIAWGGSDWPGFRGPNRDGRSTETGLLKDWAARQPALLWKMSGMGAGFSSVSISGTRLYTMGDRNGAQYAMCFDLAEKKELWATKAGKTMGGNAPAARCTPTLDGDLVYITDTDGDLMCLNSADGKVVWQKSFSGDFGGKMMSGWGYSESPLIDGDQVVVTPGGRDALLVALNKKTGDVIWKCQAPAIGPNGGDGAGYSSIVAADCAGVRQYITLVGRGAVGVRAKDGKFLWGYNKAINPTANITSPVVNGDEVFLSTGYGAGSAMISLSPDGSGGVKAEEKYFIDAKTFNNHHGGMVLVGDYLYGGHGQNNGTPYCIEFKTGKVMWKATKGVAGGAAAVLYADGHLFFRYEKESRTAPAGTVAVIAATPDAYKLEGTFKAEVAVRESWAHPVIVDGKLYLRSDDTLMCYDVKAQ